MSRTESLLGSAVFLILAPGTVAGLLPWLIRRWSPPSPLLEGPLPMLAGALISLAGLAGLLACFLRFAWQGRGTPAPIAPTQTLVVTGLYRHVRNPMYLAVTALILGQALVFASPWTLAYGAVIWALFHAFILTYEEPTLRRSFPHQYGPYVRNVPRWLPRLKPWSPS